AKILLSSVLSYAALFLCAKLGGVVFAFALFLLAVSAATLLATYASAVGARLAACCEDGEAARIWRPGLVSGTCLTLGAFVSAALANRFLRARFCVTACILLALIQPLALVVALPFGEGGLVATAAEMPWRILPALTVLASGCMAFIALAGALAVRLKPAPTVALVSAALLSSFVWPLRAVLPDIGKFWLVDGLAAGASIAWSDVGWVLVGAVCLTAFWLVIGSLLLLGRELP
ncbi:MAG: hypothetical protein ACI4RA_05085, partial [Kiritimatiellia bacterium]